MLRLRTLGGLSISASDRELPAAAAQRKPLAVLALLGRANSHGISRSRLIALLWPEADEERGQQVLRQTLYALRRAVGQDEIVLGTSELRLNERVIALDATEFETLAARGEHGAALERYQGPFLDGVHVRASPEYERWVDTQRAALERLHRATWTAHCRGLEHGTDPRVLQQWEAFAAAYPTDSDAALGVVRTRLARDDRAGAIQFARMYEQLLDADLGVAPDPAFRSLIESARRDSSVFTPVEPRAALGDHQRRDPVAASSPSMASSETPKQPRWRGGVVRKLGVGAAVAATIALLLGQLWPRGDAGAAPAVTRVAIMPFDLSGTPGEPLRDLMPGIPNLLGTGIDGIAGLSVVNAGALARLLGDSARQDTPDSLESLGRRLGADLLLTGSVIASGPDSILMTGSLVDVTTGHSVASASVRGGARDLLRLGEELAKSIISQKFGSSVSDRMASIAARSTTSLEAYRAFARGESLMRAARHAEALDEYVRAVTLDSTFALAHFRLCIAADWVGRGDLMFRSARSAARHGVRLGPRERMLVDANLAWRTGDIDVAEQTYVNLVRAYPDDANAWFELGEVQFHSSPRFGRPISAAAASFSRSLALDNLNADALEHLARATAAYGDNTRADSLLRRGIALRAPGHAETQRALLTILSGDERGIRALLDGAPALSDQTLWALIPQVASFARRPDLAFEIAARFRLPPRDRFAALGGALAQADYLIAMGQPRASLALVTEAAREVSETWGPGARARLALTPGTRFTAAKLDSLRHDLVDWKRFDTTSRRNPRAHIGFLAPKLAAYLEGSLAIETGDTAAVHLAIDELDRIESDELDREIARALANGLRAHLRWRDGDATGALRFLERTTVRIEMYEGGASTAMIRERYLRGLVLEKLGRLDEALLWLESLGQTEYYETSVTPASALARARIYERLGNRDEARKRYTEVLELWKNAEPEFRGARDSVTARLRDLGGR